MAQDLILETTFLVDLEREQHPRDVGPALRFLERNRNARLHLTQTIAGELAAGKSLSEREAWESFVAPFRVLRCTLEACWLFGKTYRHLQRSDQLIGTNDLWIAATALAHGLPVVTANVEHFRRVPELDVVAYRSR